MGFSYSPKVVTDGLVLYLDAANPLSYANGSTKWNDLSRGRNNGTLINGPSFQDNAIVFDGVDDSVNTGSTFSNYISDTLPLTFEVWAYVNLSSNDEAFIGTNWSGGGVLFRKTSLNKIRILYHTNGSNWKAVDSDALSSSGWYHMVGTYNGLGPNTTTNFRVFVNAIESYNPQGQGTVTAIPTTTNVYIGQTGQNGYNKYFGGSISTAKIYNRALTAQEVQRNYQALKSRFGL